MNITNRLIKNFISLSSAEIVAKVLLLFLYIYIANTQGVTAFGELSFATALIAFFNIFADFGLTMIGIREISRTRNKTNEYGNNILVVQFFLTGLLLIILLLILLFLPISFITKLLTFIFGLGMIPLSLDTSYIFRAFERMEYVLYTRITSNAIYLGLGVGLLIITKSILSIPIAMLVGLLVGAFQSLIINKSKFKFNINLSLFNIKTAKMFTALSFSLFAGAILAGVYNNLDTIMLQFYRNVQEVGYYSAGYKIVNALLVIISFISSAFFPLLANSFKDDINKFHIYILNFAKAMGFLSFPVMVGGIIYSKQIILTLYRHHNYVASIDSFKVLLILIGITGMTNVLSTTIIAADKQKHAMIAVGCGVVVNILFNVLLIPRLGAQGAAYSILLAQLAATVYLIIYNSTYLKNTWSVIVSYCSKSLTASFVLYLILSHIGNMYIGSFLGTIIYIVLMYIIKGIPNSDDLTKKFLHKINFFK